MRSIDADALFAEFENVDWYNNADRDEIAEPLILQAPTIDAVSVVHGEWIEAEEDWRQQIEFWRCSECGHTTSTMYNFCHNCGCRMKGADDGRNAD